MNSIEGDKQKTEDDRRTKTRENERVNGTCSLELTRGKIELDRRSRSTKFFRRKQMGQIQQD